METTRIIFSALSTLIVPAPPPAGQDPLPQSYQIIFSVLIILIALGIGLFLRRILVHRLHKTVLDNWLIQLLGALVVIPPLIVGFVLLPFVGVGASEVSQFWQSIVAAFQVKDIPTLIWNLVKSILLILLAIGVGRTLMRLVTRGMAKSRMEINIRILLGRISYALTAIVVFFWILAIWNIALTVPATVISIITVGIALVIQDILRNLAAGLYILLEGPFQIGDTITTDKYTGSVEAVELRATKLRIITGEQVIVPNSMLFSGIVINKTIYDERRVTIVITMPQEEYDKERLNECILNTIKEVKGVMMKPEPTLALSNVAGSFGGSTGTLSGYSGEIITLLLRFWSPEGDDSVISDAMHDLRTALPRADLAIREPEGF
ncbi:MAG TPA: mechanosensitive ion channel family protein [Ktedonobacteraceae bacterium]|nr:mechanosensitive ion channel family protein [Ktedonobacteraceae bacterium]